jgi:hypothetical protein
MKLASDGRIKVGIAVLTLATLFGCGEKTEGGGKAAGPGSLGLNDTGIISTGFDDKGQYVNNCKSAAPGSDCNTGRDATTKDNSDGKAGFSFTKIDANGAKLPATASSWACIKDNVSGLIWENKTQENASAVYTNYGDGRAGDASEYVSKTNGTGLCGAKDWRLPLASELQGIVDYGVADPGPTIDAAWFPNTQGIWYWSASAHAGSAVDAWGVGFNDGLVNTDLRSNAFAVRLVRSPK